ncbi:unnamed protein product [Linum trigynum]|uniref:Uncharacterized protein n=1 Tax=Linum trigynum TaxID=586398 RepID=A0AAV2EBC3_9ROSI
MSKSGEWGTRRMKGTTGGATGTHDSHSPTTVGAQAVEEMPVISGVGRKRMIWCFELGLPPLSFQNSMVLRTQDCGYTQLNGGSRTTPLGKNGRLN